MNASTVLTAPEAPKLSVPWIVLVSRQRRQCASQYPENVKQRHGQRANFLHFNFDVPSKFIQDKHVEREVHPIGMHQGMGEHTMLLVVVF